jgi:hypothetical protein
LSERAPVEETICSSSISIPGKGVTSEPLAIKILFVFTTSFEPSGFFTYTSFGTVIVPIPLICPTLFALNNEAIPLVNALTDVSLAFII